MLMHRVLFQVAALAVAVAMLAQGRAALAVDEGEHHETTASASDAAGEHGDAHHIGAPHKVAGPEEFKSDLAIWSFVVFLLLLAILWKFAWKHIAAALEKREHGIAENIAAAQRTHEEAKRLLVEYEERLAHAADKVRELLDEARRDAEHTKTEILAEAKAASQAERDRGLREIAIATDGSLKQLAEASANAAVELAGKIVRTQLGPAEHGQLVQEAMERFQRSSPSQN